jgi:hypothetical protein
LKQSPSRQCRPYLQIEQVYQVCQGNIHFKEFIDHKAVVSKSRPQTRKCAFEREVPTEIITTKRNEIRSVSCPDPYQIESVHAGWDKDGTSRLQSTTDAVSILYVAFHCMSTYGLGLFAREGRAPKKGGGET